MQRVLFTANPGRFRGAGTSIAACAIALSIAAFAARQAFDLGGLYLAVVLGSYAAAAVVLVLYAGSHPAGRDFGAANRVTLLRGALMILVLGLLAAEPSDALAWFAVIAATSGLILDGVDGFIARRRGSASAFGARFDMETDAALILVLALLAWHFDKAGAWVILSGLLRYLFVAAGWWLPWLHGELPPSRRRQTMCVLQVATLLVCLAPLVPAGISHGTAALGLVALAASFAVDVALLARRSKQAATALPVRMDLASRR